MYRQAGGDELVHRIMDKKRAEGTTIFTVVHHRETPLRILKKTVDVGPVWATDFLKIFSYKRLTSRINVLSLFVFKAFSLEPPNPWVLGPYS